MTTTADDAWKILAELVDNVKELILTQSGENVVIVNGKEFQPKTW